MLTVFTPFSLIFQVIIGAVLLKSGVPFASIFFIALSTSVTQYSLTKIASCKVLT